MGLNASPKHCAALMVAAALLASPPALAQDAASTAEVAIGDLDLSLEADAGMALQRITATARTLCGGEPARSPAYPRAHVTFRACVRDAVNSAVASTDSAMLARLHGAGNVAAQTAIASK